MVVTLASDAATNWVAMPLDAHPYAVYNLPLKIVLAAVIGLWRLRAMTSRPATAESWAITIAFLALGTQLVLETIADHENLQDAGRPYIAHSIQMVVNAVFLVAVCGWFAAAETGAFAWRVVRFVAGLGVVAMGVGVVLALGIPAGTPLHDEHDPAALRYFAVGQGYWPIVLGAGGLLAFRALRRAYGALRVALGIAVVAQWLLAVMGLGIAVCYLLYARDTPPPRLLENSLAVMAVVGFCLYVLSFAAVASAHRTKQLASLVRAQRDARALRQLLRDLESRSPELAFPSTGWTPLMLRPHAARLRHRTEVRDRIVTLSPRLATMLAPSERQEPRHVAKAIARLLHAGQLKPGPAANPVPILTATSDSDQLIDLARHYAHLGEES